MVALRRTDWDKFINEFMAMGHALDRYSHDIGHMNNVLAQARVTFAADLKVMNTEIDRLRDGIRAAAYLTGQAAVREMLQDLLSGPPPA